MVINIYVKFPCCGKYSYRYVKVESPCSKHFTVHHLQTAATCPISHNIKVDINWNKSKTKLKATVKWLQNDSERAWPANYPLLSNSYKPTI